MSSMSVTSIIEIRGFKACFWFNVCNDSCTFSYSLQQRNTCPCCCCCCSNLQKVSNVNQLPCSHVNMSKTLISIYHAVYVWFQQCDQLYILLMHVILTFSGRSTLRESWQAEMNQILCNEKDLMLIYAKRHVFLFMIAFFYHKLVVCNAVQTLQLPFFK